MCQAFDGLGRPPVLGTVAVGPMKPFRASKVTLGDAAVSRIRRGTNRLTQENEAFVREAIEAGIEHVDTAHLYTGGDSEVTIGEALSGGLTDDVVVAPKGGFRDSSPDALREEIEESLRRLRTD